MTDDPPLPIPHGYAGGVLSRSDDPEILVVETLETPHGKIEIRHFKPRFDTLVIPPTLYREPLPDLVEVARAAVRIELDNDHVIAESERVDYVPILRYKGSTPRIVFADEVVSPARKPRGPGLSKREMRQRQAQHGRRR